MAQQCVIMEHSPWDKGWDKGCLGFIYKNFHKRLQSLCKHYGYNFVDGGAVGNGSIVPD